MPVKDAHQRRTGKSKCKHQRMNASTPLLEAADDMNWDDECDLDTSFQDVQTSPSPMTDPQELLNSTAHLLVSAHDGARHKATLATEPGSTSLSGNSVTLASTRKRQSPEAANADGYQPQPDVPSCIPLPPADEDAMTLNCGLNDDIHSADRPPVSTIFPPLSLEPSENDILLLSVYETFPTSCTGASSHRTEACVPQIPSTDHAPFGGGSICRTPGDASTERPHDAPVTAEVHNVAPLPRVSSPNHAHSSLPPPSKRARDLPT